MTNGDRIGLVDGSVESDSRTFHVVIEPEVLIQLDELVAVETDLPGGAQVTHYGIVTELRSRFEGADLPSDTGRVVDRTLPAEHVRRAEVRVLRVVPELFVAPHAGAVATRAVGAHRTVALFEDEMTRGKLPVGLDLGGAPVYADMRFVDGRSGGHVSISGISGVATKTSYALFLLYQLLETEQGMDLLGGRAARENVRALVFNTKGEDLLHLDRANTEFAGKPEAVGKWRTLGVDEPGPFRSVRLYAPRQSGDSRRPSPTSGPARPPTSAPTAGPPSSSSASSSSSSVSPRTTSARPRSASWSSRSGFSSCAACGGWKEMHPARW